MQDTYYLENGQIWKTHTLPPKIPLWENMGHQTQSLEGFIPGRCFRNENIDASHENTLSS